MCAALPTPVLSVSPDAVQHLDGTEALSSLWTLFTKCKSSLHDGRRLENLSWRLWYQEMHPSQPFLTHTSTPSEHNSRGRRAALKCTVTTHPSVGAIICKMLPTSTDPAFPALVLDPVPQACARRRPISAPSLQPLPARIDAMSCLPTPETEKCELASEGTTSSLAPTNPIILTTVAFSGPPSPCFSESYVQAHPTEVKTPPNPSHQSAEVRDRHPGQLFQLTMHPQPSARNSEVSQTSQLLLPPPKLVVVNPTPSPTPHPTPPATPLMTVDPAKRPHWLQTSAASTSRTPQGTFHAAADPRQLHPSSGSRSGNTASGSSQEEAGATLRPVETYLSAPAHVDDGLPLRRHSLNRQSVSSTASEATNTSESSGITATTDTTADEFYPGTSKGTLRPVSPHTAQPEDSSPTLSSSPVAFDDDLSMPSHLPHSNSSSPRKKKRNSAPPSLAAALGNLTAFDRPTASSSIESPTSPAPVSSVTNTMLQPGSASSPKKKPAVPAGLARRASSGGSSVSRSGKSERSRSREPAHAVAPMRPFAVTAGGGKKGGRGRSKFTLSRTTAAKANRAATIKRENSMNAIDGLKALSSSTALDEEKARLYAEAERVKEEERARAEAEKERELAVAQEAERRRAEEAERERLALVEKQRAEEEARARRKELEKQWKKDSISRDHLAVDPLKRPVAFKFGSNSDDGSGVGSKSTGSSDVSGERSSKNGAQAPPQPPTVPAAAPIQQEAEASKQQQKAPELPRTNSTFLAGHKRQLSKPQMHQLAKLEQVHQSQGHHRMGSKENGKSPTISTSQKRDKGKGKEKAVFSPPSKSSRGKEEVQDLDPKLLAKVSQHLADPLLPGANKRTVVLATSESEFETDSDDDEWFEETSAEDVKKQRQLKQHAQQEQQEQLERQQKQQQLLQLQRQQQGHQRQQVLPTRPPGPQRTQSSHYPANTRSRQVQRELRRTAQAAQATMDAELAAAAEEAKRQREMFQKLPRESFQDLGKARTQSFGLLTHLLNPNPEIFPPTHPYRRNQSHADVSHRQNQPYPDQMQRGQQGIYTQFQLSQLQQQLQAQAQALPGARQLPTNPPKPAQASAPPPPPVEVPTTPLATQAQAPVTDLSAPADAPTKALPSRKSSSSTTGDGKTKVPPTARKALSPSHRAPSFALSKTAVAGPVSSQIAVGSVTVQPALPPSPTAKTSVQPPTPANGMVSGGYRPRGPPQDQEMDPDSESDNEDSKLPISRSVAQERLLAYAAKRGIVSNPSQAPLPPPPVVGHVPSPLNPARQSRDMNGFAAPQAGLSDHISRPMDDSSEAGPSTGPVNRLPPVTAPIPVGHPYNLPPAPPPSTPRTTRRRMLSTELSESLRRNLLWERQVSKGNIRRTASQGGNRHSVLGGLQPLTAVPSMVQLRPKGMPPPAEEPLDQEERKRRAVARNKSWADDYHYSGW